MGLEDLERALYVSFRQFWFLGFRRVPRVFLS